MNTTAVPAHGTSFCNTEGVHGAKVGLRRAACFQSVWTVKPHSGHFTICDSFSVDIAQLVRHAAKAESWIASSCARLSFVECVWSGVSPRLRLIVATRQQKLYHEASSSSIMLHRSGPVVVLLSLLTKCCTCHSFQGNLLLSLPDI